MDDGLPVMAFGGLFSGLISAAGHSLQTGAVEFPHPELICVDAVEAAHVEHDHVFATRPFAIGVRLDAAGGAKRVMDCALVELVVRDRVFAGEKFEVGHWNGGQ